MIAGSESCQPISPMPPEQTRGAETLERMSWELARLRDEADAIGQPLLGYILDQEAVLAATELADIRIAGLEARADARQRVAEDRAN